MQTLKYNWEMVAPACVVIHPPGEIKKSEVSQRVKSMAEYVVDDGSRCVGDFLLNRQRLLLLMIFSRV